MAVSTSESLQSLTDSYQTLQSNLQTAVAARQKLESQKTENSSVAHELSLMTNSSANIYKMVGPVLLKQERQEADSAVQGRLTFINGELSRIDGNIKKFEAEEQELKMKIIQAQSQMQAAQQSQS